MNASLPFHPDHPVGLMATIQKSGTWYHHFLFGTYDRLLSGGDERPTNAPNFMAVDSLRLNLAVLHTICPGFLECCDERFREKWNSIRTLTLWSHETIQSNLGYFSPIENKNVRIIFVYRNLFDQCFSAHRHLRNHINPERRALVEGRDVNEFITTVGINNYLSMFSSFTYMAEKFESNIMFLPYERVMADRKKAALDVLRFFGRPPTDAQQMAALDRAIAATTRDNIRAIEAINGHPLANDQTDPTETHIRSGESGLWRPHVTAETVEIARAMFRSFGLDLDKTMADAGQPF